VEAARPGRGWGDMAMAREGKGRRWCGGWAKVSSELRQNPSVPIVE